MSLVVLMSGGLDSSLAASMAHSDGIEVIPVFVQYGQLAIERELAACRRQCAGIGLSDPIVVDVAGFGRSVPSGLTDALLRVNEDAFLPGRNLLFLLVGAAIAYSRNASGVVIGLLDERARLFPDQSKEFVRRAEEMLSFALGRDIRIVAPLIDMTKQQVMSLAVERGLTATYSCHAGTDPPCGHCVSCIEAQHARSAIAIEVRHGRRDD